MRHILSNVKKKGVESVITTEIFTTNILDGAKECTTPV